MTAQISDGFEFEATTYSLVDISEDLVLFDPKEYGISPLPTCSACWRGYVCKYMIVDNFLVFDRLTISIGKLLKKGKIEKEGGPAINKVLPYEPKTEHAIFNNIYENLKLKINYTGGLLIAKDFIEELYVHMGFHPAWKYKKVYELIFEKGHFKEAFDRSDFMTRVRTEIANKPYKPNPSDRAEIIKWIASCFSFGYKRIFAPFEFEIWQEKQRILNIKEKAQEAFRNKQYKLATELYKSIEGELTPTEKKKKEYATKRQ